MKENLCVSVSGGKTSMYMMYLIITNLGQKYNLVFVFANTSQENEETLIFVQKCAEYFDVPIIWVEAIVHDDERKACTHTVVNFETAHRNGEIFEKIIEKYGIPNSEWLHCTRELKENPIKSYLKSLGWEDYKIAIGIRMDEFQRVIPIDKQTPPYKIYPMTDPFMLDKIDVNNFWESMPFNLDLLEHEGNCKTCHKKSDKKLHMLIKSAPERFEFTRKMEEKYALSGCNIGGKHRRTFFRRNRSTNDLFKEYELIASSGMLNDMFDNDVSSSCSESCEPFMGE